MVLTDDQKEKTAYHEAGHAVVGLKLPQCDPVYKATIIRAVVRWVWLCRCPRLTG